MSTNRHTPTGAEILMIAQGNPHITIGLPIQVGRPNYTEVYPKPRDLEHDEQVKVCQWAEQNLDKWGVETDELFAIPNGGKRSKATAGKLKAEGVRSGVPDMMLAVPVCPYPGLFIEMKVKGNRPSAKQARRIDRLRSRGYFVVVAYSAGEAIRWIELYLDGKLPLDK